MSSPAQVQHQHLAGQVVGDGPGRLPQRPLACPVPGHAVQSRTHRQRAQHQRGQRPARQQGLGVTGEPLGQHRQRNRIARVAGMQELQDPHRLLEQQLVVPAHQPGDTAVGPQHRQPRPVPGFGGEHRAGGRPRGGLAPPCFPIPLGRPIA
jgi:hypothetical protein